MQTLDADYAFRNAQHLVRAGFPLMGLNGKIPIGKEWQKETKWNRHRDPEDMRMMQYSNFGWQIDKEHVVVDVDEPDLFPWEMFEGHTARATSGGGNGTHILCDHDGGTAANTKLYVGDIPVGEILRHPSQIRVAGGLCTHHQSPEFLRKESEPVPDALQALAKQPIGTGSSHKEKQPRNIRKLTVPYEFSTDAPEGTRNDSLLSELARLCATDPHTDHSNYIMGLGDQMGLTERECAAMVRSNMVKWQQREIAKRALQPQEPTLEPTTALAEAGVELDEPTEPTTPFITGPELQEMDIPPIEFWQEPYGPGQAVFIYGYTGHGKSLWTIEAIMNIKRPTAYIDGEMGSRRMKARIGADDFSHVSFWFMPEQTNDWFQWDYSDFDLIVIDTKSALWESKFTENDAEHWDGLAKFITKWTEQNKCVILVHHTGKDQKTFRGSSNAGARFDTSLHITMTDGQGTKPKRFQVKIDKNRNFLDWNDRTYYRIDGSPGYLPRFLPDE